MTNRQIVGILFLAAGLAVSSLALRAWRISVGPAAAHDHRAAHAGSADHAPDLSVAALARATLSVDESGAGFRVPTREEMIRARTAIAAELELLSPGPARQIPTTSGIGYTLGMRGASVALFWPQDDQQMAVRCHDVPAPPARLAQEGR